MRLISYRSAGEPRIGVRTDNGAVVDLHAASDGALPTNMVELLEGGDAAMAAVRDALARGADDPALHAPADFELLPVVPRPPKIICVARNYGEHAAEANLDVLEQPNLFIRFAQSLLAAGDPIQVPVVSDKCDWEAELAVIIGKPGRHIAKADALDHVAGYAIFNDVSIRDWQLRKPPVQFGAGKNFDASGPFGPDLVTADEVPDPGALAIELRVNGEVMQASSTSQMIFDVPTLIEYISKFTTLEAGDVIATGTPSGVGHFRTPPRYLVAGDTVRIDLETIGVQESPVVDEEAAAA
jgi:2-keto-4-pentenoate hydratase/2-oxohepta-3-ene-1,7-dioic acid hydratase in catechol pathway